jgi:hypothetical protein
MMTHQDQYLGNSVKSTVSTTTARICRQQPASYMMPSQAWCHHTSILYHPQSTCSLAPLISMPNNGGVMHLRQNQVLHRTHVQHCNPTAEPLQAVGLPHKARCRKPLNIQVQGIVGVRLLDLVSHRPTPSLLGVCYLTHVRSLCSLWCLCTLGLARHHASRLGKLPTTCFRHVQLCAQWRLSLSWDMSDLHDSMAVHSQGVLRISCTNSGVGDRWAGKRNAQSTHGPSSHAHTLTFPFKIRLPGSPVFGNLGSCAWHRLLPGS